MCRMWHNMQVSFSNVSLGAWAMTSPIAQGRPLFSTRWKYALCGTILFLWKVRWHVYGGNSNVMWPWSPNSYLGVTLLEIMWVFLLLFFWELCLCSNASWSSAALATRLSESDPPATQVNIFIYCQMVRPLSSHGLAKQFQSEMSAFLSRATGVCHAGRKWCTSAPWPSSSSCSDRNRVSSQWTAEEKGGVVTPGAAPSLSPTLSCPQRGLLPFPTWSYCETCLSSWFKGLLGSPVCLIRATSCLFCLEK